MRGASCKLVAQVARFESQPACARVCDCTSCSSFSFLAVAPFYLSFTLLLLLELLGEVKVNYIARVDLP